MIVFPNLAQQYFSDLWEILKPWQLVQLGASLDKEKIEQARSVKFDVRAIWANLSKRSQFFRSLPEYAYTVTRFGQIRYAKGENDEDYFWLIVESPENKRELLSGFWIGKHPLRNRNRFHWSISRHDLIAKGAIKCEKPEEFSELAICVAAGEKYLWIYEQDNWILLGKITIINRVKDSATSIRGIYIQEISIQKIPHLPRYLVSESDIEYRLDNEISTIAHSLSQVVPMKCQLTIDSDRYVVRFTNSDDELCDERSILRTSEVLDLLRQPMVKGVPLRSLKNPKAFLTWDPYSDIDYGELQLLKPYIERRTPYIHVRLPLPLTAKELASTETNYETVILKHDRNLCPLLIGSGKSHDSCWRVEFPDDLSEPTFYELSKRGLFDYEIVNLVTGGIFLETGRYEFSTKFDPEPSTREGVVFLESGYLTHMLGMKSIPEGTYLKMEEEQLVSRVMRDLDGPGVRLGLYSDLTGEEVYYWLIVTLESDMKIENALSIAKDGIQGIVSNYFGDKEEPSIRIHKYDELMAEIRDILRAIRIEYLEEIVEEKDADTEVLEELLQFRREDADDYGSIELAETLFDFATLHLKNNELDSAQDKIEECIEMHEEYLKRWKNDSVKKSLTRAKTLRRKISYVQDKKRIFS